MSPPALVIRFELEAAPRVYTDELSEAEARRLWEWLEARHEYAELVARALALSEKERAA